MENSVQPFQKYGSSKQIFDVDNSLEVNFGDKRGIISSFKMSIAETENNDKTKNWLIEKIEEDVSLFENPFMEILNKLEQSSYPLEIKVDDRGVFLKAKDHKKTVENWKLKTESLKESYNNADAFLNQYLSALESDDLFYENKFKEPFWNLLFFAPSYLDNGMVHKEKITWFIKSLGEVECEGSIKAVRKDFGFESIFKSEFNLPENLILELNKKYKYTAKDYKVILNISMNYNSSKKYYFTRSAEFTILEDDKILYQEICIIN